ncbi:MAG: hypothetical protein JSR17_08590 [Proteobacteria bacterium]|nr:hypothetical protein [Pseudomonadota bacterium]
MYSGISVWGNILRAIIGGSKNNFVPNHPLWTINIDKFTDEQKKLYQAIVPFALSMTSIASQHRDHSSCMFN